MLKGDVVTVTGEIRYNSYTDKENNKKYFTEIVAHTVAVGVTPVKSNFSDMGTNTGEEEIPF